MSREQDSARRVIPSVLAAVASMLLVSGCVGGGLATTPSSGTTTTAAISSPSQTPQVTSPVPSTSHWPDVGQAPVADPVAGLYLSYATWGDIGGAYEVLVILADGRIVTQLTTPDGPHGQFLNRRLNESGLALVHAQVAKVALFDRTQFRKVVHSPNCCGGGNQVTVVSGGKTNQVGEATLPAGSYASSRAWDRFEALVANLAKPDSWIPSTGWSDEAWTPFHAATYCLILRRDYQPELSALPAASLTWPAGVRPFASFGASARPGSSPDDRLGIIPATSAYELARSIAEAATAASVAPNDLYVPLSEGGWLLSPWIDDPDGGDPIRVDLWPASPGVIDCPVSA